MNIYDLAEKSKIPVKKLRVLDKLGALRHDARTTELDGIHDTLRIGNRLSVGQLVYLLENPAGLLELGKYAGKAEEQMDALGDAIGQAAPRHVSAQILGASEKEPEACEALIAWAKTILPAKPVGHSYIAARLLLGVPENARKHDIPRLRRVMDNCRSFASFNGWHAKERIGTSSRYRTVYQKLALDL